MTSQKEKSSRTLRTCVFPQTISILGDWRKNWFSSGMTYDVECVIYDLCLLLFDVNSLSLGGNFVNRTSLTGKFKNGDL
jgi:hypothetical protein